MSQHEPPASDRALEDLTAIDRPAGTDEGGTPGRPSAAPSPSVTRPFCPRCGGTDVAREPGGMAGSKVLGLIVGGFAGVAVRNWSGSFWVGALTFGIVSSAVGGGASGGPRLRCKQCAHVRPG